MQADTRGTQSGSYDDTRQTPQTFLSLVLFVCLFGCLFCFVFVSLRYPRVSSLAQEMFTSEANASTVYTSSFGQPVSQHGRLGTRFFPVASVSSSCTTRRLRASFARKTRKHRTCSAGYFNPAFALVFSRSVRVKSKHKDKARLHFKRWKCEACVLALLSAFASSCKRPLLLYCNTARNESRDVIRRLSSATSATRKINKEEKVLSWMRDISLCLNVRVLASLVWTSP